MLGQAAHQLVISERLPRLRISESLLRQLVLALIVAALLEVLLLRLATRVGVHVPRSEALDDGIQAASFLGTLAFNSASILAIGLAVLLFVLVAMRIEDRIVRVSLGTLASVLLVSLGLSLAGNSATVDGTFGLASAVLAVVLGVTVLGRKYVQPGAVLALASIIGAYLCYQYYSLSHITYRILDYTSLPPLGIEVLRWGEVFVILAGVTVFWAWGRPRWRRVGRVGVVAILALVVAVGLSSAAPSSTTSILALWTTGMSFFLPTPLYLAALALYLVTVVACFRDKDAFWTGAGLLLVLVAGYMPEATYHHLLIILGVGFLAGAFQMVEEASGRASAMPSDRTLH
jgi:hypothetical protein